MKIHALTFGIALIASGAYAANTYNLVVDENYLGWGGSPAGVAGDYAPGWGSGSITATSPVKEEVYFTPQQLFGRAVTLGEIKSMSWWTKKADSHVTSPNDWYQNIYTTPTQTGWYGYRIGAEAYLSANLTETPGAWNQWSSDSAINQLRFFNSTGGYYGGYTDKDWTGFLTESGLSAETVKYFSMQTGSGAAAILDSQVDGYRIELSNGDVANINFEAASVPDAGSTLTLLGFAVGALASARRWMAI